MRLQSKVKILNNFKLPLSFDNYPNPLAIESGSNEFKDTLYAELNNHGKLCMLALEIAARFPIRYKTLASEVFRGTLHIFGETQEDMDQRSIVHRIPKELKGFPWFDRSEDLVVDRGLDLAQDIEKIASKLADFVVADLANFTPPLSKSLISALKDLVSNNTEAFLEEIEEEDFSTNPDFRQRFQKMLNTQRFVTQTDLEIAADASTSKRRDRSPERKNSQ